MRLSRLVPTLTLSLLATACGSGSSSTSPASPPPPTQPATESTYQVTVTRPAGGGVASVDGKLNCGTTGTGKDACGPSSFGVNASVTLSAAPEAGMLFDGWAGNCSGKGTCTVTGVANDSRTVAATFVTDPACTACHGTAGVNAAPPKDLKGNSATTLLSVGAHQAHLRPRGSHAVACSQCHTVPGDTAHATNPPPSRVVFGSLASKGTTASWSHEAGTCASTYCHGGTSALAGGTSTTPVWNKVDGTYASCTACHGAPPPFPHPQRTDCGSCHVGYTVASTNPALHVNGTVDLMTVTCSSCHGDPYRLGTDPYLAAMPPMGTHGESQRAEAAVGAHEAHMAEGKWARAFSCSDCHTVPTSNDHATGVTNLTWSFLSSRYGKPSYDATRHTCASTYCHGNFPGGNADNTPTWTATGPMACDSCHGLPPPAPHPVAYKCGKCHPGYDELHINKATHVNGIIDVVSLSCTTCHGTFGKNAAPPFDTADQTNTLLVSVGAHQAHVNTRLMPQAIACTECHGPKVASYTLGHMDGTVQVEFGATANKDTSTVWNHAQATCATSYCHGGTSVVAGGSGTTPIWTQVDGTFKACTSCHGSPPPLTAVTHHPQNTACAACHGAGYTATVTVQATHLNGALEITRTGCTLCHGDLTLTGQPSTALAAAPGFSATAADTTGQVVATAPGVGAHKAHLAGTRWRSTPIACNECHVVPVDGDVSHATGTGTGGARASLVFGTLSTTGSVTPTYAGSASGVAGATAGSCASTYCHGNFTNGAAASPTWLAGPTAAACGSCHGLPPGGSHPNTALDCSVCHPGYTKTSVDPATHIDGTVQIYRGNCSACHDFGMNSSSGYHHVMAGDPGQTYPVDNGPSIADSNRNCAQCHVKHPDFAGAGGNLRDTINSATPTASTLDRPGCISCHEQNEQVKDTTRQATDGTVKTPRIDSALYASSSHTYTVDGSFGGSAFQVDCVKCHNSTAASQLQTGAYQFTLHDSPDRRLRGPLGRSSLVDDDGEGLCYRCHSTTADAIGGTVKTADANDWYGVVTNMPSSSTNVYAQSQKGSGVRNPQPVTTSTLYFKPSGEETVSAAVSGLAGSSDPVNVPATTLYLTTSSSASAAPAPVAYILASSNTQSISGSALYFQSTTATVAGLTVPQSGDTLAGGTQELRDMLVTTPSSTAVDNTNLGSTGTARFFGVGSFVSPAMTQATTVPAGNWVVNVSGRKTGNGNNNTTVTAYARYNVYVWKSDGSKVAVAGPTTDTTALTNSNANRAMTAVVASPVTLAIGDRMAVDLEATVTNTITGGNINYNVGYSYTNLTVPGTNTFTFSTTSTYNNTTFRNPALSFTPATGSYTNRNSNTSAGIISWDRVTQFTTPALATPYAFKAGSSLFLTVRTSQTALANGCYLQFSGYRWKADNTQGETLGFNNNGEPGAATATPFLLSTGAGNQTFSLTTANDVTFAAGDKFVIEVQVYKNGTATTSAGCTVSYGGATDQSNVTIAAVDSAVPVFVQPLSGSTWASRSMSPGVPTIVDQTVGASETAAPGNFTQYWKRASFVSPPVRTATTLAAAPWQLNVWDAASNANVIASIRYRIYQWTAANTQGADIVPWTTGLPFAGVTPTLQQVTTAAGAPVSLAAGDRVVVELEVATSSTLGGSSTNTYRFGSTSQSNVVLPSQVQFTYPEVVIPAWGRHDFAAYRGLHRPNAAEETGSYLGANKHVGCEDCHNPHASGPVNHTVGSNAIPARSHIAGVPGQEPTFAGAFAAPTGYTQVNPSTKEYQICFKCHSGANPNLADWNAAWTDLAVAFNPANASSHPVVAALGSAGSGSTKLLATQLSNGWTPGQTMYCSDCHGNDDTAGAASQGPHGSAAKFMLKGPNTRWPTQADGSTRWTWSNRQTNVGTKDGLFCWNCHPYSSALNTGHSTSDHSSRACTACHVLIPHGGKVARLIVTYSAVQNGFGAYVDSGACTSTSNCMTAFTKAATPTSYSTSNCGGCGEHGGGTTSW